jgi:hypothetical protein
MTVTATTSNRSRTAPIAAHAYQVPVVRELPPRIAEIRDTSTW